MDYLAHPYSVASVLARYSIITCLPKLSPIVAAPIVLRRSSRAFQFNSGSSSSNSDSPSASSVSQYGGQNSSCGTSPEPSHNSPSSGKPSDNPLDTISEGYACHGNSEGEITFCEKLNMACGNPRNPIPRVVSQSNATPAPAAAKTAATDVNGIDFLANQNGGQFDPTLFGDYRESQAAIVGDGDFTGGFFNDVFLSRTSEVLSTLETIILRLFPSRIRWKR